MASSLLPKKREFNIHDENGFEYGFESIQYQGRGLHQKLTEAVSKLRSYNPNTKKRFQSEDVEAANIAGIIKEATGLNVVFTIKPVIWENAAMMSATFDQNHIFFDQYARNYSTLSAAGTHSIALLGKEARGSVDLKNARVSGIFSKIPLNTYVTYGLLAERKLTDAEIAATILHEVGHAFTFCYYLGHVVTSNIIVTHAARRVMGIADEGERTKVLKQTAVTLGIEVPKVDLIASCPPTAVKDTVETIFINAHRKKYRSITGTDLYDFRACEQLADHFAVMHGAGANVVSDKLKLYKKYSHESTNSFAMYLFKEISKTILVTCTVVGLPLVFLSILTSSPAVEIYDRPLDRIVSVKRQLNDILKDNSLSKSEKEYTLQQIQVIREVEKDMNSRESWYNNLANIFNPNYSFYKNQVEQEKLLEDLVFNDLFEKSAELSLI